MASYIPQVTDYIPALQPFKPNLEFYGNILKQRQGRYDAGLQKLSTLYGSMLNAPLTAEDNIKRRENFFDQIDGDLKKITSMDLSLPQNIQAASSIFEPLVNDKHMAHDMVYTKTVMDEMQVGESYRGCTDKEKCGGLYWEEGQQYIKYKQQDYADASPEQRLKMSPPRYHPYVNLIDDAFKWTKEQGLVVESVNTENGYIVTRQNGAQLALPLAQIYKAMYGKDDMVRGMYDTSAYLRRKQYISANLDAYGGDTDKAEEAYVNEVMNVTAKELLKNATKAGEETTKIKDKKASIEAVVAKQGMALDKYKDDPVFKEYVNLVENEQIGDALDKYYSGIKGQIETMKNNSGDKTALLNRVDAIVSNGLFEMDVMQAAGLFAMTHSAITGLKADPYSLARVKHNYNMIEAEHKAGLDFDKALMIETLKMSADLFQEFAAAGTSEAQEGVDLGPRFGGITDAYPGYNEMFEAQQKMRDMTTLGNQHQAKYIDSTTNFLIKHSNSSDPRIGKQAKNLLKEIYGDKYDIKTNQFVSGGSNYRSWHELELKPHQTAEMFSNAKNVVNQNQSMFNNNLGLRSELEQYDQQEYASNMHRESLRHFVEYNNKQIATNGIYADNDLSEQEQFEMKNLFRKEGNRYVLKKPEDYVKDYSRGFAKNSNKKKLDKMAKEAYENAKTRYDSYFSSDSPVNAKMKLKTLSGLVPGTIESTGERGWASNATKYKFDYSSPMGTGTKVARGILKAIDQVPPEAILVGTDHRMLGNPDNENDYEYQKKKQAKNQDALLSFIKDIGTDMFSTEKYNTKDAMKKRPQGYVVAQGTAANRADLEVYTFYPDRDWLTSKSVTTTQKGIKKAYGHMVDDIIANGVSIYVPKVSPQGKRLDDYNFYSQAVQRSPYDDILATGSTVNIAREGAGDLFFKEITRDGRRMLKVEGELITKEPRQITDANGRAAIVYDEIKKPAPTQYIDLHGPNKSAGEIIDKLYTMLSSLQMDNFRAGTSAPQSNLEFNIGKLLSEPDQQSMMMEATMERMNLMKQFAGQLRQEYYGR